MGVATAWVTVMASAPGYEAEMLTTGGTMSGYWSTGSIVRPMPPTMVMTIDITIENTGWSRKKFFFIAGVLQKTVLREPLSCRGGVCGSRR